MTDNTRNLVAPTRPMTDAVCDVLAERQRQINVEGWTPEHDDEHRVGEMAVAAAYYALYGFHARGQVFWPWAQKWCKPRNRRSNLVRAAALLIAEIERIDRAAIAKAQQGGSK